MRLRPENKAKALACIIGAGVSFAAFLATHDIVRHPLREPAVAKAAPVKFRSRPSPVATTIAPNAVLPIAVKEAPVKQDIKTDTLKKAESELRSPAAVIASTETFNTDTLLAIREPLASPVLLPPVPSESLPPVPSAEVVVESNSLSKVFDDKPGGDIVVLGLLLNDQGVVIDSKILLPSAYVLGDMTVALASIGQRWESLVPPLLPGEVRWIEQRIDQRTIEPVLGGQLP